MRNLDWHLTDAYQGRRIAVNIGQPWEKKGDFMQWRGGKNSAYVDQEGASCVSKWRCKS